MFLVAEVLGELLVQRGFEQRLRELLQQPFRARQRQALIPGNADLLDRRQLLGRRLLFLLRTHNIQCRHHGTFPAKTSFSVSGQKHQLVE